MRKKKVIKYFLVPLSKKSYLEQIVITHKKIENLFTVNTSEYAVLIHSYRQCFTHNNSNVTTKNLNRFMSLYIKFTKGNKKAPKDYYMFFFPKFKLTRKLKNKRNRIFRKYVIPKEYEHYYTHHLKN